MKVYYYITKYTSTLLLKVRFLYEAILQFTKTNKLMTQAEEKIPFDYHFKFLLSF